MAFDTILYTTVFDISFLPKSPSAHDHTTEVTERRRRRVYASEGLTG